MMDPILKRDLDQMSFLLEEVKKESLEFLDNLHETPTYPKALERIEIHERQLNEKGLGALETLKVFKKRFSKGLSASGGPRYFGFVTGGTTPAALMGDWLATTFDQNATACDGSSAAIIEEECIALLKQFFGLSDDFSGVFVTGATVSNFVGLAIGRQWLADQLGHSLSLEGLYGLAPIEVISARPHSGLLKGMSMLGMGRNHLHYIQCNEGRESIDIEALEAYLKQLNGKPCIVVANAGTVNTGDFDDLKAIGHLKTKYPFYLHVDGAFGGVVACSDQYKHLLEGINEADSVTIDAHKWLNVPYDSAMCFTRHPDLQLQVFQNNAIYLGEIAEKADYVHLVPENSRRLRALPLWFSLKAYGRIAYEEIVDRDCMMAQRLSQQIDDSPSFDLLAETRLNVVCFTLHCDHKQVDLKAIQAFLKCINEEGKVFFTQTVYDGKPGIRAAFCNWRTEKEDVDLAWEILKATYEKFIGGGQATSPKGHAQATSPE